MVAARTRPGLVPLEIASLVATAVVPLPDPVPRAVPLLVVASLARWLRGRSWSELALGPSRSASLGAVAGAIALVAAVLAGTPLVETVTGRAVIWTAFPVVRGNPTQLVAVAIYVAIAALAAELALRGWVVERALELGRSPALAVAIGALAEAMVVDGDVVARLGAAAFGAGLGWLYVAAGRSIAAPLCARLAFALGAVLLEALRLIT